MPAKMPAKTRRWLLRCLGHFCFALLFLVFIGLGTWQVSRLEQKKQIIDLVEVRPYTFPKPINEIIPSASSWPFISFDTHEYFRVSLKGQWLNQHSTPITALTHVGSGYWWMTPLQLDSGSVIWVNRGFVRNRQTVLNTRAHQSNSMITIDGLIRMSQPNKGLFAEQVKDINSSDPKPLDIRWSSRDLQQLNMANNIITPLFFIDALASSEREGFQLGKAEPNQFKGDDTGEGWLPSRHKQLASDAGENPVLGLTRIHFENRHLGYAITWYILAAMTTFGWFMMLFKSTLKKHLRKRI